MLIKQYEVIKYVLKNCCTTHCPFFINTYKYKILCELIQSFISTLCYSKLHILAVCVVCLLQVQGLSSLENY